MPTPLSEDGEDQKVGMRLRYERVLQTGVRPVFLEHSSSEETEWAKLDSFHLCFGAFCGGR